MVNMKKRKLQMKWTCSDFVKHSHRWKWSAWLCGRWQYLTRGVVVVRYHYFCFSYVGKSNEGKYSGQQCSASTYSGFKSKKITKRKIEENKELAGVTNEAVLISCSYLGYMTPEDFSGED